MRLVGCHIENFGKLHNYDIQFEGERSVILEETDGEKYAGVVYPCDAVRILRRRKAKRDR